MPSLEEWSAKMPSMPATVALRTVPTHNSRTAGSTQLYVVMLQYTLPSLQSEMILPVLSLRKAWTPAASRSSIF